MKMKWKTLFQVIGYLLLAGAIQLKMGIGLGIGIVIYISMTRGLMSEAVVAEYAVAGLPYVLIVSSAFTIFLFFIMYHGQRKKLFKEILLTSEVFKNSMVAAGIGVSAWCINFSIVNSIYKAGFLKENFIVFENQFAGLYDNNILLILFAIGIIAPICEEILFRGVVYQTLNKRFSVVATIVIQAVLFGIFHLNLIQGIYTALLGILLGYIVYRTQSLWTAIIIHVTNNIMAVIMSKLLGEAITFILLGIIFAIGLGGIVLFMRLIIKHTQITVKEQLENSGEIVLEMGD